jgi:hypothetical protein
MYGAAQPKPTSNIEAKFQEQAIQHMDMGGDDLPF